MDIEDLVKFGREQKVSLEFCITIFFLPRFYLIDAVALLHYQACSYYLGRQLQEDADIILMPYNYLIDPVTRASQKINVANSIVCSAKFACFF